MITISLSALAATALVAIGATPATAVNPTIAAPARLIDATAIAQLPPTSPNQPVLSVDGQGQASGVADTAEVQLIFINYNYVDVLERLSLAQLIAGGTAEPPADEELSSFLNELEPITQASLRPVVDRLVAAGIPASAIEVNLDASSLSGTPPFPQLDSAQISLSLNRPTPAQLDAIVTAVEGAIQGSDELFLEDNLVRYTSADCEALEREAYEAAIADARDRANQIAAAAGVTIAGTPSIVDGSPTGYSELDSCSSESSAFPGETLDADASATVEVLRRLTVTYPIR